MRVRFASTVLTLMYKVAAISGLLCPAATSSAMRCSVGVSVLSFPGARRARCAAASACQRAAPSEPNVAVASSRGSGRGAALAGLALRGAQDKQAAAELERQPPLARFGDHGGNRLHGRGRVALGQPHGGFGTSAGDPRPGWSRRRAASCSQASRLAARSR
jgi:hypothetical protein